MITAEPGRCTAAVNADDNKSAIDVSTDAPNSRPLSSQPKSPAAALELFELPAGFRIELVAAEPLVQDPVAIQWGADGKLWVAEMADYPHGLDGKMSPGGRVRYLEDTDGDGRPDRSIVFLDKINFPTGVLPWRDGLLVTAAPDILYAEDSDGDGRADVRKVLFTGFKEGNPQLRVNGLQWGLDGWVYCANGWSGGQIRCLLTDKTIDLKRLDFRIQPDTGELELISGITEFGRNRDDWGSWFGCDNSNPAWHFVLEDRYLRRNPHAAAIDPRKQLLAANPRVFARSQLQKRYHSFEHADRYTSACAVTPYRDELLFADESQHLFVCEPVHNLVQHLTLSEEGVSFAASVPEHRKGRDFLTSTDPWFRPVNLRTGLDGALWVVDMYRYMIEHPEWLPDEGKRDLEPHFRAGEDRGRLYRVYREDRPPRRWKPVAAAGTNELCRALASPNGPERDIAQQQLIWRGQKESADRIREVLRSTTSAKARLQALSTLASLGAVDDSTLRDALGDSHPMMRRDAVHLAEGRLANESLLTAVTELANDKNGAVRLQVACTLGESNDRRAAEALATILAGAADDRFLTAAVFSSLSRDNLDACFRVEAERARENTHAAHVAVELVGFAAAVGRDDLALELFANLAPLQGDYSSWQINAAERWLRGAAKRRIDPKHDARVGDSIEKVRRTLEPLLEWSRTHAHDDAVGGELRAACLRIAMRNAGSSGTAVQLARAALAPQTPQEVQRIAVQEAAALNGAAGDLLFDAWRSLSPNVRQDALSAVLSRPALCEELLTRLERGDVRPQEIDAASRQRLLTSKSDSVRRRAKLLFGEQAAGDRQSIVNEFKNVGELPADSARGRAVFLEKCAACHAVEGGGHAVGPNLAALSDRSTPGLLAAILDPSRAIEPKYALYQAITRDGRSYAGILANETSAHIELIEQENRRHVIPRAEIEELSSSEKSLMPDGFEKDLGRQQLADLIAYLQGKAAGVDAPR